MDAIRPSSTGRATADFFTGSYRISATVLVYKRSLVDVLSDRITDYLDLVDIYISRINNPVNIVATYQKGSLVKEEISFVLVSSEADSVSKERFYAPNRATLPIFLTIPSFEVEGKFQWLTEIETKKVLTTETQKFLTVLDGRATNSTFPDVTFQGPAILVNKVKVEMLCFGDQS